MLLDDTVDGANSAWNAVADFTTDAADATTEFFTDLANVAEVEDIIESIQKVVTLVIDDIQDVIQDFNVTTWKKLVNDAKYVIYNLPSDVQKYISIGCNFLSSLSDLEFLPFPLDVIKDDDFETVVKCVGDSVLDLAQSWTKGLHHIYSL